MDPAISVGGAIFFSVTTSVVLGIILRTWLDTRVEQSLLNSKRRADRELETFRHSLRMQADFQFNRLNAVISLFTLVSRIYRFMMVTSEQVISKMLSEDLSDPILPVGFTEFKRDIEALKTWRNDQVIYFKNNEIMQILNGIIGDCAWFAGLIEGIMAQKEWPGERPILDHLADCTENINHKYRQLDSYIRDMVAEFRYSLDKDIRNFGRRYWDTK